MKMSSMAGFLLVISSTVSICADAAILRAHGKGAVPPVDVKGSLVPSSFDNGNASFLSKIPDIQANLDLSKQWMAVTPSPNVTFFKQWASNNGLPNTSVHDAPLYYDCGLVMNTAWGSLARDPCSWSSWTASDKMKAVAPKCSKLRYGEAYTDSYKALKLDQDTWCGPPKCGVRGDGKKCLKCARSAEFPFEPQCMDNVAKLQHSKATTYASLHAVYLAALVGLSARCL